MHLLVVRPLEKRDCTTAINKAKRHIEDYRPRYRIENRGWTQEEAKAFLEDVDRLKEEHPETYLGPEISTAKALDKLREFYPVYLKHESKREQNEEGKKQRMRRMKEARSRRNRQ
jgi:hypothetical protein